MASRFHADFARVTEPDNLFTFELRDVATERWTVYDVDGSMAQCDDAFASRASLGENGNSISETVLFEQTVIRRHGSP